MSVAVIASHRHNETAEQHNILNDCSIFAVTLVNFTAVDLYSIIVSCLSPEESCISFQFSNPLKQRFANCGPRTTGGPRVLPLWCSWIEH
jgi:hypothetical protein